VQTAGGLVFAPLTEVVSTRTSPPTGFGGALHWLGGKLWEWKREILFGCEVVAGVAYLFGWGDVLLNGYTSLFGRNRALKRQLYNATKRGLTHKARGLARGLARQQLVSIPFLKI